MNIFQMVVCEVPPKGVSNFTLQVLNLFSSILGSSMYQGFNNYFWFYITKNLIIYFISAASFSGDFSKIPTYGGNIIFTGSNLGAIIGDIQIEINGVPCTNKAFVVPHTVQ